MYKEPEAPGTIIKAAHQKFDITTEKPVERVGITERYLYRTENEGQKASYRWRLSS